MRQEAVDGMSMRDEAGDISMTHEASALLEWHGLNDLLINLGLNIAVNATLDDLVDQLGNLTDSAEWGELTAGVCEPPDPTTHLHVPLLVLNVLLSLPILGGNALTLVLVCRYPRLHTPAGLYAVSLAAADLCMGLVTPVYAALNYGRHALPRPDLYASCSWCLYLLQVSATTSNLTLLALTVDRYVAVVRPLRYPALVTPRAVVAAVAAAWTYGPLISLTLLAAAPGEFNRNGGTLCSVVRFVPMWYFFGVFIPHMLLTNVVGKALYSHILCIARRQGQADQRLGYTATNRRALTMSAKLIAMFTVCWMPYFVLNSVVYLQAPDTPDAVFVALEFSKILGALKSALNPVVYFWNNKDFRTCLGKMCQCFSRKGRKVDDFPGNKVKTEEKLDKVDMRKTSTVTTASQL